MNTELFSGIAMSIILFGGLICSLSWNAKEV